MSQAQSDRKWVVQRWQDDEGLEPEDSFRDRVQRMLADVEATGTMIGGAFYLRPSRVELAPGVWETVAWHIAWVTEGAARRATGEFERKQPEPEPEPALVGGPEEESET